MNKTVCTLVTLFICINFLTAQYSWNKPKWTYGFVFGFDLGMKDVKQTEAINFSEYSSIVGARNEAALLSYRIGFDYSRYLKKNFFVKTGLRIINPTYESFQLLALNAQEREALLATGEMELYTTYKYSYLFLEFPLHLRYVYSGRNCRSYVELGLTTAYYLRTKLENKSYRDSDRITVREDIFPFYFSGVVSIGAEYDLNDRIPAFIQLVFRGQLNDIDKGLVSERMYSMGVEAGTRYYF